MIIAFEGPDKAGKSTSASTLAYSGCSYYNMTKESYQIALEDQKNETGLISTFDRIDWLTHTIYRLALPGYEWNDERVRTVFAAPQAHLVFKIHNPDNFSLVQDDLYEEKVKEVLPPVNTMYKAAISSLRDINEGADFSLFKSITTLEVSHVGGYSFRCLDFSSPIHRLTTKYKDNITTDTHLMDLLLREEQHQLSI